MTEQVKKTKAEKTPRQAEIARLVDKGGKKRSDQENARLDQLRMEERRDRFLRHAARRVNAAVDRMKLVANLGNKSSYSYTESDAEAICGAMDRAAKGVMESFSSKAKEQTRFTL